MLLLFPIVCNCQIPTEFYQAGFSKFNRDNYVEAIQDFNKAIIANPNLGDAFFMRGLANLHLGNNAEAMSDLNKSLDLGFNHFHYHSFATLARGLVKFNLGDISGAMNDFEHGFSSKPSIINSRYIKTITPIVNSAYLFRGHIKMTRGDCRCAIKDFEVIIENFEFQDTNPDPQVYLFIGLCKEDLNLKNEAIDAYSKAISLNRTYAEAFYYRGVLRVSMGDKTNGCSDLSRAGELGLMDAYEIIKVKCN